MAIPASAQRTVRLCALLTVATLLAACICCYGCAAHTYRRGPVAPETPSDPQTVLWATGAYVALFFFIIASSALLLTISSVRRHGRKAKRNAQRRAELEQLLRQSDNPPSDPGSDKL